MKIIIRYFIHAIVNIVAAVFVSIIWLIFLGKTFDSAFIMGMFGMLELYFIYYFIPCIILYWFLSLTFKKNDKILIKKSMCYQIVNVSITLLVSLFLSIKVSIESFKDFFVLLLAVIPVQIVMAFLVSLTGKWLLLQGGRYNSKISDKKEVPPRYLLWVSSFICGRSKSSFPATRKIMVRSFLNDLNPLALRLAA